MHRHAWVCTARWITTFMGEGAECIPAVVVRGWPGRVFNDSTGQDGFLIPAEDALFAPLLACFSPKASSPPRARRSCPCCGGRMIIIETFERGCTPRHRPTIPIRFDTS